MFKFLLLITLSITPISTLHSINHCLESKIASLVTAGCNYDPNPQLYKIFQENGSISMDLDQGIAPPEQAPYIYPEQSFYKKYFEKAIQNPLIPISGDVGTGMKFDDGFILVQSSFINLCSQDGIKVAHVRYRGSFIMKDFGINTTQEEIRRTAWQIICEEKLKTYKQLLTPVE